MTIRISQAEGRTPAPDGRATGPERTVQCALCGHRFQPSAEAMSCGSCPMNRRCRVLCCPHCGYEFPMGSVVVEFLRRLFRR